MGVPFVGSAGQLLDQMLGAVKLDRQRVYITNIIPWRPPGNRPPTIEEIEMMRPLLKNILRLLNRASFSRLGEQLARHCLALRQEL